MLPLLSSVTAAALAAAWRYASDRSADFWHNAPHSYTAEAAAQRAFSPFEYHVSRNVNAFVSVVYHTDELLVVRPGFNIEFKGETDTRTQISTHGDKWLAKYANVCPKSRCRHHAGQHRGRCGLDVP